MAGKQVIFVRGGRTQAVFPWQFFHFHPSKDDPVGVVMLAYFDYPDGKLKVWNSWTPARGKEPTAKPDSTTDIDPKINMRFSDRTLEMGRRRGSVLALYDYVKKQPAGSVISLQVFSHGDYDGPIIWAQSFESVSKSDLKLPRDPHDSEFRRRDFFGSNPLAAEEGKKFAAAFAPDALVKLWGCTEDSKYRVTINRYNAMRSDAKKEAQRLALLDSYLDVVDLSFAMGLARVIGQPVWSAAIGWGSNPWPDGQKYTGNFPPTDLDKELWWRIPLFLKVYQRFYTDDLGASIDATRFVGFADSWYQAARRKATGTAAPAGAAGASLVVPQLESLEPITAPASE